VEGEVEAGPPDRAARNVARDRHTRRVILWASEEAAAGRCCNKPFVQLGFCLFSDCSESFDGQKSAVIPAIVATRKPAQGNHFSSATDIRTYRLHSHMGTPSVKKKLARKPEKCGLWTSFRMPAIGSDYSVVATEARAILEAWSAA
jgi:hypothetical protein